MRFTALLAGVLVFAASSAAAQTLGDLARQEAERRKTIQSSGKATGKVYTNDSLRREVPPVMPAPAAATPPAAAEAPAQPAPAATDPAAAPPAPAAAADAPRDEASWRKRMTDARDALSRAEIFADALQSRINALSTDFVNRDDPAQRNVIASERQKALAELDRVKQDIQNQQKAIATIQDEARKAGVPAGWVR